MYKKSIILLLIVSLCLSFGLSFPAAADHDTVQINNVEEFLQFAENCKVDTFSNDLTVSLNVDIDLTNVDFAPIPIFSGTFNGNNHTISGLQITAAGSYVGLFRYLTASATVSDLHIAGSVTPGGTATAVGGVVGQNAGTLINCSFSGTVSGTELVGGIAGSNLGTILNCQSDSTLYGNHFIGGIAGDNAGFIQGSKNLGNINTDPQEATINLSDITIQSITGAESSLTVTDIGGITGLNSGVINQCENHGQIGYDHIGYNIGGISGNGNGFITECKNYGSVFGRKEVGGITGQLEPAILVQFDTDTLQTLQVQLNNLSAALNRIFSSITSATSGISKEVKNLQQQIRDVETLLKNLNIEDVTSVAKVIEALGNLMTSANNCLNNILSHIDRLSGSLQSDVTLVNTIMGNMQNTISHSTEDLGGTLEDISELDTDADTSAKVSLCENYGPVAGDMNCGGIVGAISFENDMDPEQDITLSGENSLNVSGQLRAVIKYSKNFASIACKRRAAGGIVGFTELGLVQQSSNLGQLNTPSASYVGGIAGYSNSNILQCTSRCVITADMYAGGIAGTATKVRDCYTLCSVTAKEKFGAVIGYTDNIEEIINNFYAPIGEQDPGSIDSISYTGNAHMISFTELMDAIDDEMMEYVTVTFLYGDGTTVNIQIQTGAAVEESAIPQLPILDNQYVQWDYDGSTLYFDTTITLKVDPYQNIWESQETRDNGLPVWILEGNDLQSVIVQSDPQLESVPFNTIEVFQFSDSQITTIHYLPPEQVELDDLSVYTYIAGSGWQLIDHTVEGSYLIFDGAPSGCYAVICQSSTSLLPIILTAAILAIIMITPVVIILICKKKRCKKEQQA